MKIIQLVSDKSWQRASRLVQRLCRPMISRGHDVVVATHKDWEHPGAFTDHNATEERVSAEGFASLRAPSHIMRMIGHGQPTVIIAHSLPLLRAALRARTLSNSANVYIVASLHHIPGKLSLEERICLENTDLVTTDSEADAMLLAERGCRSEARVLTPSAERAANAAPLPCTISPDTFTFIYHGTISQQSGAALVVEAFIRLAETDPRLRLIMCGQGAGREVMPLIRKVRSASLDARVTWAGTVDDIYSWIDRADAGIYPDMPGYGFRMAPVECAARGRISATPAPTPDSVAEAMRRLADTPAAPPTATEIPAGLCPDDYAAALLALTKRI